MGVSWLSGGEREKVESEGREGSEMEEGPVCDSTIAVDVLVCLGDQDATWN